MSRLADDLDKLQDTFAEVARAERDVAEHPDEATFRLTLRSLERRRRDLESRVQLQLDNLGVPVCSYRLFSSAGQPRIAPLSAALEGFQKVYSVVYDALRHGPKQQAHASDEAQERTAFEYGYAFPGSAGFVFTMPRQRQRDLLADPAARETAETIFDLAGQPDSERIRQASRRLGPGPIRALLRWVQAHATSGLGADISWSNGEEPGPQLFAEPAQFEQVRRVILQTTDEVVEDVIVTGDLVGGDVFSRTFHLRTAEGTDIQGRFSDAIPESTQIALPISCQASLRKTTVVRFSTEEEEVSFLLMALPKRIELRMSQEFQEQHVTPGLT